MSQKSQHPDHALSKKAKQLEKVRRKQRLDTQHLAARATEKRTKLTGYWPWIKEGLCALIALVLVDFILRLFELGDLTIVAQYTNKNINITLTLVGITLPIHLATFGFSYQVLSSAPLMEFLEEHKLTKLAKNDFKLPFLIVFTNFLCALLATALNNEWVGIINLGLLIWSCIMFYHNLKNLTGLRKLKLVAESPAEWPD